MNYAASLPRPDTVSIAVSGPSTALAYARALAAKAKSWAVPAILHVKLAIKTLTRIPRVVGNIALSALSTQVGYDTIVTLAGKAAGFLSRRASKVIRSAGSAIEAVCRFMTGLLRHVAPTAADAADRAIATITDTAESVMTSVESRVASIGQVIGVLVRRPLVVLSTIRAAGLASAALVIHALTQGAAAARIVQLVPKSMTAVVWLTNPWKLLLGVAAVMATATAFAAFRLGRSTTPASPTPHLTRLTDETGVPAPPTSHEPTVVLADPCTRDAAQTGTAADNDADAPSMVAGLRVAIGVDGSIEVHGVPAHLPEDEQRRIAQTAADAAATELHRVARRGRAVRAADRRHIAKAAQAAVLDGMNRFAPRAAQ